MIELKNVTKEYVQGMIRFPAIRDITLTIEREMVAVIGTSGAGKSTLLNVLAGLEPFEAGEVRVDEYALAALSERELAAFRNRCVGIVMQHYALIQELSVLENVYLPLNFSNKAYRKREKESLAKEVLRQLGILDLANRQVSDLSGGEMQRVAIARALINQPRYLLADEPTGALDSENTDMVLKLFRKINQLGIGVVLITHDMDVANRCDRIIELRDGQIIRDHDCLKCGKLK